MRYCLFILLILFSNNIFSQSVIEIGPGFSGSHSVSSTAISPGHLNPYHLNTYNGKIQILYTAAEIAQGGGIGVNTIDSIGWYVISQITNPFSNYTIKLQNSTISSISNNVTLGWTTVRNAAPLPAAIDSSWYMIALDNPFIWDGINNLLIEICWSSNSALDFSGQIRQYSPSNGIDINYKSSLLQNVCATPSDSATSFKPYLKLSTYCPTLSSQLYGTICDGQSYPFNGTNYTTTGVYIDSFVTAGGCDSIMILNLTVNPIYNITVYDTFCSGTPYPFGNQNLTSGGTYNNTFLSAGDCDSNVQLILFEKPSDLFVTTDSICWGDSINFQNTFFSQAGVHQVVYTKANGCDSIYELNLTYKYVDTGLTRSGNSFFANASSSVATFQWFDCDLGQIIMGQTGQAFSATMVGSYAVIVTMINNECIDTSRCELFANVESTDDYYLKTKKYKLYPIPVKERLYLDGIKEEKEIWLMDLLGKVLLKKSIKSNDNWLDISNLKSGIYIFRIDGINYRIFKD